MGRTGTLEILLSEPITRGQLILEKFASLVASMLILAVILWVVLAVGSSVVNMDISLLRLAEITTSVTFAGLDLRRPGVRRWMRHRWPRP